MKLKAKDIQSLADELGIIRAQQADLKDREAAIKAALVENGVDEGEGKAYRFALAHQHRTQVDWKTIAAKLKPSRQLVAAHTTVKDVIALRVNARKGIAA